MVRILLSRSGLVAFALASRSQAFVTPRFASPTGWKYNTRHFSTDDDEDMKKHVLVPIGDGSEEIETTCITDTLTRFGAKVTVASVMPDLVCTMSRGIKIMADMSIDEASHKDWDLVALPGGMPGAENLRDSPALIKILEKQRESGKLYGAVCASPAVVLASKGLDSEGATCYPAPAFREKLTDPSDEAVVIKGNLVTSQGPGTSLKFALALGEQLYGKEKADQIAAAMLVER